LVEACSDITPVFEKALRTPLIFIIIAEYCNAVRSLPVTTVDIPEKMIEYMDELVRKGIVRYRKQVILGALESYRKLEIHRWSAPYYNVGGQRVVLINEQSFRKLMASLSEQRLRKAGRELGHAFKNHFYVELGTDTTDRSNWGVAFDFLRNLGWGNFTIIEKKVHVTDGGLNFSFIHGCLEALLSVKLLVVVSNVNMAIFEIENKD